MADTAQLGSVLDRIQGLTRNADQKAAALGFAQLGVPSLLASSLREWFTAGELVHYKVFVAVATVLWALSLLFTALVFFARTENKGRRSLTFFGDIARLSLAEFDERLESLDDDGLRADLRSQIWVCSDICRLKYVWLDRAMKVLGFSWGIIITCYFVRGVIG